MPHRLGFRCQHTVVMMLFWMQISNHLYLCLSIWFYFFSSQTYTHFILIWIQSGPILSAASSFTSTTLSTDCYFDRDSSFTGTVPSEAGFGDPTRQQGGDVAGEWSQTVWCDGLDSSLIVSRASQTDVNYTICYRLESEHYMAISACLMVQPEWNHASWCSIGL